jgi:DNA-binding protein HU-beta
MASAKDVAKLAGTTSEVVASVMAAIVEITRTGESVVCQGFGTFSKKHKEARDGRNPATGEALKIAAKDVLHFKPSPSVVMIAPKAAPARRRG